MKSDPIQDFILESEKNLNIAAAISKTWPEVKAKIADGFFNRLGIMLTTQLKGWKFETHQRFFIDTYPKFFIWKPAWDYHFIALQCNSYGKEITFGVFRDEETKKRPLYPELLAAVKTIYPNAKPAKEWYEALIKMSYPAADWQTPEVLWRIHTDPSFLDAVAEQLLDMAKVSAPIIDRLVQKK